MLFTFIVWWGDIINTKIKYGRNRVISTQALLVLSFGYRCFLITYYHDLPLSFISTQVMFSFWFR